MWKNKFKTLFLMSLLAGLLMLMGGLIGGSGGLTVAFIMALMINGIMYFFSDKIVLSMYRAEPLKAEQYPEIVATVSELCRTMQLPMPRLWIINHEAANAFATGRNPAHSSVAFTTGILNILEPHELRGVIAHELSHIANRDILISTIAAVIAATIGYIANMIQHTLIWGNSHKERAASRTVGMLFTAICMPFIALLIRLGISRSREYDADATGAHACNDPLALASALQKLQDHTRHHGFSAHTRAQSETAGLFIVYPFSEKVTFTELFSTHPPLSKRIQALHTLHNRIRRPF